MKIFVNNNQIVLHEGATVIDAVRKFYAMQNKKPPHHEPIVKDAYGNTVALDGSLSEGGRLEIRD